MYLQQQKPDVGGVAQAAQRQMVGASTRESSSFLLLSIPSRSLQLPPQTICFYLAAEGVTQQRIVFLSAVFDKFDMKPSTRWHIDTVLRNFQTC
jgi:hypothetical protein